MSGRVHEVARRRADGAVVRLHRAPAADTGDPADPRVQRILELQRTAGNAAVVRYVQRDGEDAAGAESGEADAGSAGTAGTADAADATANTDRTAEAKAVFDKGAAAYEAHDYAHAYDFFARAYELANRPTLLFDQAQALRRLGGRREEAIALYEQYLASGAGTRTDDATKALAELRTPESTGDVELDTAQAKALFDKGAAAYEAGDFAHAADDFGESYELAQRPGLLFSEAQSLRRLGGHPAEAIDLYQAYIDTGEATRGDEAQAHIEALRAQGAEPR